MKQFVNVMLNLFQKSAAVQQKEEAEENSDWDSEVHNDIQLHKWEIHHPGRSV